MRGLSLAVASGGHFSSWCTGLSPSRPLLLWSTGSRRAGSVVVAHGPSCSAACGIFTDQGLNPCPLHWQADSQPLSHQGSPPSLFFCLCFFFFLLPYPGTWVVSCLLGGLRSSASVQWVFYRSSSTCRCISDVFLERKVISMSYSSAILKLPEVSFSMCPSPSPFFRIYWYYFFLSPSTDIKCMYIHIYIC